MTVDLSTLPQRLLNHEASRADRAPTEAQKEAGNYRKGHIRLHGLDITIENAKGSVRSGVGKNGKKWSVALPDHYGYVKRSLGADGDHVDVYIGPHPTSLEVFVVDQVDSGSKKFDEHKVMLGYDREESALSAYHKAFSDGKAKDRIGGVTRMSIEDFKQWLRAGDTSKPIGKKMPLLKGKENIGHNIKEIERDGHPRDQSIAAALRVAKRANGGHVGPLVGTTPGRADEVETTVPDGSHVIPADIVAHLGGGNSLAGLDLLNKRFPHRAFGGGIGMPRIPGAPRIPHLGMPRIPHPHITAPPHLAGVPGLSGSHFAKGGEPTQVPCKLSDGEFVVGPDHVRELGQGDPERGHRTLDEMILKLRKESIAKQKALPAPVGSHKQK